MAVNENKSISIIRSNFIDSYQELVEFFSKVLSIYCKAQYTVMKVNLKLSVFIFIYNYSLIGLNNPIEYFLNFNKLNS